MDNQETPWAHKSHDEDKKNKKHSTTQTIKKMHITDPDKKNGVNQVITKGKQIPLLM